MENDKQPNKIALVTGASSGIGEAISRELVHRGWQVIGVARSAEKLTTMQAELSEAFMPMVCDISIREEIDATSKHIFETGLCPSLFFLNAGSGELENCSKFDLEAHEKTMRLNYFGVLAWVDFWEKPCLENGGANFIATSSLNAIFAPPSGSAYSASKAAIAKALESLSLTYFNSNLRFSVVYPGPVDTPCLKGKLPFTWSAEKMGKRMVDFAISGKAKCAPFLFYNIVCRILSWLPARYTMKLLNRSKLA
jgi:3-hydroxy acid dehydrogenase/malonic semialdehyde reductase